MSALEGGSIVVTYEDKNGTALIAEMKISDIPAIKPLKEELAIVSSFAEKGHFCYVEEYLEMLTSLHKQDRSQKLEIYKFKEKLFSKPGTVFFDTQRSNSFARAIKKFNAESGSK